MHRLMTGIFLECITFFFPIQFKYYPCRFLHIKPTPIEPSLQSLKSISQWLEYKSLFVVYLNRHSGDKTLYVFLVYYQTTNWMWQCHADYTTVKAPHWVFSSWVIILSNCNECLNMCLISLIFHKLCSVTEAHSWAWCRQCTSVLCWEEQCSYLKSAWQI